MEIRPLFCKLISRVANNIDICMMHTLMHFTKALYWKALIKDDTVAQKFNLPSQSSPSSKAIKNVISSHRWALPIKGWRGKITNRGLHFKNEFSRRLGNCLMFSIWSPLLTLLHLVFKVKYFFDAFLRTSSYNYIKEWLPLTESGMLQSEQWRTKAKIVLTNQGDPNTTPLLLRAP